MLDEWKKVNFLRGSIRAKTWAFLRSWNGGFDKNCGSKNFPILDLRGKEDRENSGKSLEVTGAQKIPYQVFCQLLEKDIAFRQL